MSRCDGKPFMPEVKSIIHQRVLYDLGDIGTQRDEEALRSGILNSECSVECDYN